MNDEPRDLTRLMLQVLFIGALMVGSFWVLRPFLLASLWAATIVVATWPVLLFVQKRLWQRRGLAVAVMTVALLAVLLAPMTFGMIAIAQNADRMIGWARSLPAFSIPPPPDWIGRIPLVGSKLVVRWLEVAAVGAEGIPARLAPYAGTVVGWLVARIGGVGMLLVEFLLTVIIAAIMYSAGEAIAAGTRRFARRLGGAQGESVVDLSVQAVRAVALGVVVTALIQSVLAGIGLAVAGVPFVTSLTGLMLFLAIAQIGIGPILFPAVAWLYWRGDVGWGTVLLVWSVFVLTFDNILRPVLIRQSGQLPLLLIFPGVIGGLIGFGILGVFIGPVIIVVAFTLLKAWLQEAQGEGSLPVAASQVSGAGSDRDQHPGLELPEEIHGR
ncbi:MAG TPA: AI-2E family transporter YdiK [Candidatus Methylomirabilis sp.]|nr:AI-2E family transporter YdiK [Candidatus Methylomirabilis sp.]